MDHKMEVTLLQDWIAEELEFSKVCAVPATAHIHRKIAALYSVRLSELQNAGPLVVEPAPSMMPNNWGAPSAA